MSIKTGWFKVSDQSTLLRAKAKGNRIQISSYHPYEPYLHSIMWGHDCCITDIWYCNDILYSLDEGCTLKIWKWQVKNGIDRFNNIGDISNTLRYRNISNNKIEIEHLDGRIYLYEQVLGKIVKVTPRVWRPTNSHLFPKVLQERLDAFWEVWRSEQTILSELPPELMVCISSLLATGRTGF